MRIYRALAAALVSSVVLASTLTTAVVNAAPVTTTSATVDHVTQLTAQRVALFINSPAMGRMVQVQVLLPKDQSKPRPSLYLLDGVEATDPSQNTWTYSTDVVNFFSDKSVNVVLPVGGTSSMYTDWDQDDPTLGRMKWETFLARELPPIIDSTLGGNGRNAVAGLSMGADGALMLATRNPDLYQAVGAYSGCGDVSTPAGITEVYGTIGSRGGDPKNMWGDPGSPQWAEHDPIQKAEALRGKAIYLSAGSGLAGSYDNVATLASDNPDTYPLRLAIGGALEFGSRLCTQALSDRLMSYGIPATVNFRPFGIHQWRYWQDDLHDSWPTLARGLGL